MDNSCEIIDLCVKSEKSYDTSTTIPFEENAEAHSSKVTEKADVDILAIIDKEQGKTIGNLNYTEKWISEQNALVSSGTNESTSAQPPAILQDVAGAIPIEITELVNMECAIKLINHLVIYAFHKVMEADLHNKLLSITPDIDPQINIRSRVGFQCVYERCVVLFYEALLELTEILNKITPPHQAIVILWMYDTVESLSKAHGVDSSFLRNEKYIERLLRDFCCCQNDIPGHDNIFFNIYQKMQPTVVTVQNQPPTATVEPPRKRRRPRKPRAKKSDQLN